MSDSNEIFRNEQKTEKISKKPNLRDISYMLLYDHEQPKCAYKKRTDVK